MEIPIKVVIKKAGGVVALSKELHITKGAVSQWNRVPLGRVAEVERITGIPRGVLRPDVFGAADSAHKQQEAA